MPMDFFRKLFHSRSKFQQQLELGSQKLQSGDFSQAIECYSTVIGINPRFADAYCGRGYAYHKQGKYELALTDFNKAIELNPDFALAYNNRGLVYKVQGD